MNWTQKCSAFIFNILSKIVLFKFTNNLSVFLPSGHLLSLPSWTFCGIWHCWSLSSWNFLFTWLPYVITFLVYLLSLRTLLHILSQYTHSPAPCYLSNFVSGHYFSYIVFLNPQSTYSSAPLLCSLSWFHEISQIFLQPRMFFSFVLFF